MNTENRVSPQAPEIEEAIIGACLIEQRAIPLIADKLRPEMFYVLRHQVIYAAILAMYHAGIKIDILTVKEELSHRGKLEEAGGAFGITQLSSKVATSAHLEYHAQIVHEKYLRREMILGFNKLLACALDETMDIDDSLMDAHNLLDRLEGESGHHDHIRCMDTLMTDTLKEAELRIAKSVNGVTGIPMDELGAQALAKAKETAKLCDKLLASYSGGYLGIWPVTLTADGWAECTDMPGYAYKQTAALRAAREANVPSAVPTPETFTVAVAAGLAGVCETKDGSITFWAENVPESGIQMPVSYTHLTLPTICSG